MGLFALLQFRENFFETNWSFENKKDCFFEAIFCGDFHVSCKYYSFWCFFTFRSKIFNRVVRTTLYLFKVKFWRNMCFWEKSPSLLKFSTFCRKNSGNYQKISQQGCKKKFRNVQRDILKERDVFWREKFSFWFNSCIWAKIFTSLWKTFEQGYHNFNLTVQRRVLRIFFEMKYIYFFVSCQKMDEK